LWDVIPSVKKPGRGGTDCGGRKRGGGARKADQAIRARTKSRGAKKFVLPREGRGTLSTVSLLGLGRGGGRRTGSLGIQKAVCAKGGGIGR